MNPHAPDSADLVEDLTYRCLEAPTPAAVADLLAGQPESVRAQVQRRLALLQRVGLAGEAGTGYAPERFGPFRLLERIGAGAMGVVHRATRDDAPGEFALKLLHPGLLPLRGARLRFRREIAALRDLAHPAICPILDDGEVDGVPWLAMPFVAGENLRGWLARTASARAESRTGLLAIVEQLALALHHAHERGFVHRDVKPANVIVRPDGSPVLLDFGLARLDTAADSADGVTLTGAAVGTPAYMAPEQVAGTALDRRCDVYALGAVLYEGLTGSLPHAAPTRASLYRLILAGEVRKPSQRAGDLSRDLDIVCLTALERDPARRYATALALAEDVRRVRLGVSPLARLPGPWRRVRRWARRHPLPSALLAVLVLATLGIVLLAWQLWGQLGDASSRALAAYARTVVPADPHAALHLALQAYDGVPTREAIAAVQAALAAERPTYELAAASGPVLALQFGADARHLLSVSAGVAQWWNLATQSAQNFPHGARLAAAALSADGRYVLTAGEGDGRLCLFETDKGERVWERAAHAPGQAIALVRWSPDGARLASCAGGVVRIWSVTGEPLADLPEQGRAVTAGAWLDATTFAIGTGGASEGTEPRPWGVGVWKLADARSPAGVTIERIDQLECAGPVLQVVDHPRDRGLLLVISREKIARLWRVGASARTLANAAPDTHVIAGGFLEDGARVITAAYGGRISAWDLEGQCLGWFGQGLYPLRTAIVMPASATILHDAGSGMVWLTNDSGLPIRRFGGERVAVGPLAVAADATCIAATAWDGKILVWRVFDTDHPVLPYGRQVHSVLWLLDGSVVVAGDEGTGAHAGRASELLGRVLTFDAATGRVQSRGPRGFQVSALFGSADGSRLIASRSSNVKYVLESLVRSGAGWVTDPPPVELHPDGRGCISGCVLEGSRVAACMVEGRVQVFDLRTRDVVLQLPEADPATLPDRGLYDQWYALAATPDAATVCAGGAPGWLHRFDRKDDGSYRETRTPIGTRIAALALLPDGSILVAGAAGYLARHFDDGRQLAFRGHLDVVRSVTWTRLDGHLLIASGDRSGALHLWREDGTFLREIPAHEASIWSLCFSPDGRRIVSGSADGTARVWWTREEDVLRIARASVRPLTDAQRAQFSPGR